VGKLETRRLLRDLKDNKIISDNEKMAILHQPSGINQTMNLIECIDCKGREAVDEFLRILSNIQPRVNKIVNLCMEESNRQSTGVNGLLYP
jgi:shikimate kinase